MPKLSGKYIRPPGSKRLNEKRTNSMNDAAGSRAPFWNANKPQPLNFNFGVLGGSSYFTNESDQVSGGVIKNPVSRGLSGRQLDDWQEFSSRVLWAGNAETAALLCSYLGFFGCTDSLLL